MFEALRRVRRELDPKIALIGFCGAPWTVATYMVAGQGTPDQAPARMMAYRHPKAFAKIIDVLVENSIQYLLAQLKAGADVLQIFDTWAGVLPPREFARWSIEPTRRIVEGVRAKVPDAKIIGFPRGAGALLPGYVEATGVDAVSIDWAAEPSLIRERVQNRVAVQGNLDPLALIAGGAALDRAVDDVLANYARRPADLQSRPRHPAGNPDRACRADAEAGAGVSRAEALHRPAALDDLGRALGQQFEPDRAAEFARRSAGPEREASMNRPPASSSTEAVSDICAPSMVENPAIGELQWPLSTHSTSRSASALRCAAGSSIADRMRRVCQSLAAHSTATIPCPTAGSIS